MAEPWCRVNGCPAVQAVSLGSFRKGPTGVHEFCGPPACLCGSPLGLSARIGQMGERRLFVTFSCRASLLQLLEF